MNAKDALKMLGVVVDGVQVIQGMTKVGGDRAEAALAAIDKIVSTLRQGIDGVATPQAVAIEIEALRASLVENDAAADVALREKFGR